MLTRVGVIQEATSSASEVSRSGLLFVLLLKSQANRTIDLSDVDFYSAMSPQICVVRAESLPVLLLLA